MEKRERLRETKRIASQNQKGARAIIGKKKADGRKVFVRQPPSRQGPFKQQNERLAKLDLRCARLMGCRWWS